LFGLTNLGDFDWVGVADGDTAHVHSSLDLEETFVSPVSTPRVLDEPVVHTIEGAITDGKNSVVDVRRAVFACSGRVDTTSVVSEAIDDFESNGDWSILEESVFERNFVTLGDVKGSLWD